MGACRRCGRCGGRSHPQRGGVRPRRCWGGDLQRQGCARQPPESRQLGGRQALDSGSHLCWPWGRRRQQIRPRSPGEGTTAPWGGGRGRRVAGGGGRGGGSLVGEGEPTAAGVADGWLVVVPAPGMEREGRERRKIRNLALYHVGNPNPNSGLVFVLIDQVRRAWPITQG
jgi:hypothetical protein